MRECWMESLSLVNQGRLIGEIQVTCGPSSSSIQYALGFFVTSAEYDMLQVIQFLGLRLVGRV
jgi:hypothetical protein